ncbi:MULTISPECIES: type 1 glutamine amidotransferase domain-containing protein [unclassified Roseateles]|uniref:type 1 glutamine amidotransferase domain-containing protein n=1 Tax=unclassified Roseateles TaxID=2626991 RepID=UPI0006FF2534|nr:MULTISPECIES: type 1 glutamine amidotransferase domain-containing protein [unclassified Roseateles]KQW46272.1 hypothetical protein ASC81_07605 [Pelomonas sp. Root405]KRA73321.1 hypothetical protein ASD88_07605 [Pelomonas sp. Root662]
MHRLLLAASLAATLGLPAAAATTAPGVLLVVSSEGRAEGTTINRPGFEMDELAMAWLTLRANGLQVQIASPAGGAVVADRHNPREDHIAAFLADADGVRQLQQTRRTEDVKPGEHAAIFLIGGKGAMFDLPRDTALLQLLAAHQGVLAAVCHGPAALLNVRTPDGRPLVAGRRMTGFSDEEEKLFGKKWAKEYPFWLETRARELGAQWEEAPLMMPKLVVDGPLVTGQNPFSTTLVAEAIVRQLGRTPQPRTLHRDEASMQLVTRWLAGEQGAVRAALAAEPKRFNTDLIAMLGYYQSQAAVDDAARRQALSVMELAAPHMAHAKFRLGLAQAYAQLAQPQKAREVLTALLAAEPANAEARVALSQLNG